MIDFNIVFEQGDAAKHDYYIAQFHRLLRLEAMFYVPARFGQSGRYIYLNEFGEMDFTQGSVWTVHGERYVFDPRDFTYLFFDMSGNGSPNLVITNGNRINFVLAYDTVLDRFYLWKEIGPSRGVILGTGKIRWGGGSSPLRYIYTLLDEQANIATSVEVAIKSISNGEDGIETLFLLALPEFANSIITEIPYDIWAQANVIHLYPESAPFFIVGEHQFNQIAGPILNNRPTLNDINEVTFTYDELFNNNDKPLNNVSIIPHGFVTLHNNFNGFDIRLPWIVIYDDNLGVMNKINQALHELVIAPYDIHLFNQGIERIEIDYKITQLTESLLSVYFFGFIGGARGNVQISKGITISINTGQIYTINDFIIYEERQELFLYIMMNEAIGLAEHMNYGTWDETVKMIYEHFLQVMTIMYSSCLNTERFYVTNDAIYLTGFTLPFSNQVHLIKISM